MSRHRPSEAGTSRGFLTVVNSLAWPLPASSSLVFLLLMIAYPLTLGSRNYGFGQAPGSVIVTNAHLQLDLSWMHVLSDVFAAMYGAWVAYKACSPRSMISPPWRGTPVSRYVIPMVKAGLLCAVSYPIACAPAIYVTLANSPGPFPWYPLLSGMAVLFAMCCCGFACGVITGSRWSVLIIAIMVLPLCAAGMFLIHQPIPQGDTFPRTWGNPLSLIMPVSDTGIGAEPGLRMTFSGFLVRTAFFLIVAVSSVLACVVVSYTWTLSRRTYYIKATTALLVMPVLTAGGIAWVGPAMWARTEPFTPVCENVEQSGIVVCSHPDDIAHRRQYVHYVQAALQWVPATGRYNTANHGDLYLLLGNAFTPTGSDTHWNITKQGTVMISDANATAIELMTDTVTTRNSQYSDLSDMMRAVVERELPAPCAADARSTVFKQDYLHDGADITAFILEQLPLAMRATAYNSVPVGLTTQYYVDDSSDQTIQILGTADDHALQSFISRNAADIESCSLTAQKVAQDPIAEDIR